MTSDMGMTVGMTTFEVVSGPMDGSRFEVDADGKPWVTGAGDDAVIRCLGEVLKGAAGEFAALAGAEPGATLEVAGLEVVVVEGVEE